MLLFRCLILQKKFLLRTTVVNHTKGSYFYCEHQSQLGCFMYLTELCPAGNRESPGSHRKFSADAHTLVPMKCNSNLTNLPRPSCWTWYVRSYCISLLAEAIFTFTMNCLKWTLKTCHDNSWLYHICLRWQLPGKNTRRQYTVEGLYRVRSSTATVPWIHEGARVAMEQ